MKLKKCASLLLVSLFIILALSQTVLSSDLGMVNWKISGSDDINSGTIEEAVTAINKAGKGVITLISSDVYLHKDITVSSDITINTESGVSSVLYIVNGVTLTNNGSITSYSDINVLGTIINRGVFSTSCTSSFSGKENVTSNEIVSAHLWDSGVITSSPTKDKTGTVLYVCMLCGTERVESIARLGSTDVFAVVLFSTMGGFFAAIIICAVITKKMRDKMNREKESSEPKTPGNN